MINIRRLLDLVRQMDVTDVWFMVYLGRELMKARRAWVFETADADVVIIGQIG